MQFLLTHLVALALAFTLPLLALSTATTPSSSSLPNQPPLTSHSRPFTLHAHVISGTQPYENFTLEPYPIAPEFNYAVLFPGALQPRGIVGVLNGTGEELRDGEGDLLFDSGSGKSAPYGFVIDKVNSTYNPIEINAGPGTKGIFIDQGVIKYRNPISGGFYACNETLRYGSAIQVFYKPKVIVTPANCSDIELVVRYVD